MAVVRAMYFFNCRALFKKVETIKMNNHNFKLHVRVAFMRFGNS